MVRAEQVLVHECESFLSGRYAWERSHQRTPVPEWAWLGALAHAPVGVLVGWANESGPAHPGEPSTTTWRRAVSLLSAELLDEATWRGCPVEDVQRSVLVPLELDQARPGASRLRDPGALVDAVRCRLRLDRGCPPR